LKKKVPLPLLGGRGREKQGKLILNHNPGVGHKEERETAWKRGKIKVKEVGNGKEAGKKGLK